VGCGMSGALGGDVGGESYRVAHIAAPLSDDAPATTTVAAPDEAYTATAASNSPAAPVTCAAPACTAHDTTTIAGSPSATYGSSTGSGVSVDGNVGGVLGDSVGVAETKIRGHQPESDDARVGALAFLPEPPWSALALRSCSDWLARYEMSEGDVVGRIGVTVSELRIALAELSPADAAKLFQIATDASDG